MEYINPLLQSIVYAVSVFVFILIAKKIADYRVADIFNADTEIIESKNWAVSFRRSGLYLGVSIGMYAAIVSSSIIDNFILDVFSQMLDGAMILAFLFIAMYVNDKILLKGISNDKELAKNNISVGLVECGAYISTGLIAYGSFAGTGPWYSSIVFFVLGQMLLVVMVWVYEYLSDYDALNQIKDGNISAGMMVAGMMVAYAFILQASLVGPFNGWYEDIIAFFISAASGIVLLILLFNKAIDRFLLPGSSIYKEIKEDDIPPILVVIAVKVAVALIISGVVI